MSVEALREYERARSEQLTRNEARRIRTKIHDARNAEHDAGVRWPFELLQNALDAGPRRGQPQVDISLSSGAGTVVFEHNSAPFSLQELAALLSGGSSKEFESQQTTGRFGTGFLVTHVLAEATKIRGLLDAGGRLERFELTLDRAGDEDAIMRNIDRCNEAIGAAVPVELCDGELSARFEYAVNGGTALHLGLEAFRSALPYLFASSPNLGRVLVADAGATETWTPAPVHEETLAGALVVDRVVSVAEMQRDPVVYRSIRVMTGPDADSWVLIVARRESGEWTFCVPEMESPRLYCRFPVRSSQFLSLNCIVDGRFDLDQERRMFLLNPRTKALVHGALRAIPAAIHLAVQQRWTRRHTLAWVAPVGSPFIGGPLDKLWWSSELLGVAQELSRVSLVETRLGRLPAISQGAEPTAHFLLPRLSSKTGVDETSIERFWPLVDAAQDLYPPTLELASDWSQIAIAWTSLGIKPKQVTLEVLARSIGQTATSLTQLRVRGEPLEWLARLMDLVGECWESRKGIDLAVLQGLLPDQSGSLHSPTDLCQDGVVPDTLKDIAESLGVPIRSRLLAADLACIAQRLDLKHFGSALSKAVPRVLTENDVIAECVDLLQKKLDKRVTETNRALLTGSVRLLDYLSQSDAPGLSEMVRKIPFVASDNGVVRCDRDRSVMAPVPSWPEAARLFHLAYPPSRILSPIYAGDQAQAIPDVVRALVAWDIAIDDPLTVQTPADLKDRRLAVLALGEQDTAGATVTGQEFTQIALLSSEVLNRCQEGVDEARALLGLVLQYVAARDTSWRESRVVDARRAGAQVELRVLGALWLARLSHFEV